MHGVVMQQAVVLHTATYALSKHRCNTNTFFIDIKLKGRVLREETILIEQHLSHIFDKSYALKMQLLILYLIREVNIVEYFMCK